MEINQPLNGGFKKVEFNFTGFMPFEGVSENPTELLMKEFLRRKAEGEVHNMISYMKCTEIWQLGEQSWRN